MDRRKAIKNMGASLATMVLTPSVLSLLQSCRQQEQAWIPSFYKEEEGLFVKHLIDQFLPPSGNLPGAIELNLHIFIDKYRLQVLSVIEKGPHRKSLKMALDDLLHHSGKDQLAKATQDDYAKLMTRHLGKSYDEQQRMVDRIADYMKENGDDVTGLPKNLRIFKFLNDLRELAVWSYQVNERVGETIMVYKPIPGEQKGCVDLQDTTHGKAWSLN